MKWPPDFSKQPFYALETPYALVEMDELFNGDLVRDEYFHVALCVLRENDKNAHTISYPGKYESVWRIRYTFPEGLAHHLITPTPNGCRREVMVNGEPMKNLVLRLVRELAIFSPSLERYID